jgi:hypothetical protein
MSYKGNTVDLPNQADIILRLLPRSAAGRVFKAKAYKIVFLLEESTRYHRVALTNYESINVFGIPFIVLLLCFIKKQRSID